MMKKIALWMMAICLMLSSGCSTDELYNENGTKCTLNATAESFGLESRVGFDLGNGASFFWNSGDAIGVGSNTFSQYTTNCTDRSESATFTGYSEGEYAIYPFSGAQQISGPIVTYRFASVYNYGNKVDTDFFSEMSVAVPMWAKVAGNSLSFKHLGGLIAFKLPNLKAGEDQTFTLTANKRISGDFEVNLSAREPVIQTEEATDDDEKKVVINFTLENDATAVFYVPVPLGTYNISIEVKNGTEIFTNSWNGLVVERRDIRYTSVVATQLQGTEATVVADESKVTEAMEEKTSVIVNNITSDTPGSTITITIPKKEESADVEHSLAISNIDANTTTIQIDESDSGTGNSIEKLVVSVPTLADAKKLIIDMPNTTVTIEVEGVGTMTLDEVMAVTADNTLIIAKDVTVGHLKVKQGNVKIYGKVNNISRTEDNKDDFTCVICEEGATVPKNIQNDEKIKVITPIWNGKTLVETTDKDAANSKVLYEVSYAEELAWVLRNWNGNVTSSTRPTTIKLMKDINFGGHEIYFGMTEVGGFHSITLDGNNHVIKNYKVAGVNKRAALFPQTSGITIKDLTIDGAVVGNDQTSTDLYSGALIGISTDQSPTPYTTIIENVTVQNSSISGVNKVGGLIGQANGIHIVSDVEVKNTTITGYGDDAGSLGGLYGYLKVEGESSFTNSKMTGGSIVCESGEDKPSRGSSGFIGTLGMTMANSSLELTDCEVSTTTDLSESNTATTLNEFVGAIRPLSGSQTYKATLTINGETIDYNN